MASKTLCGPVSLSLSSCPLWNNIAYVFHELPKTNCQLRVACRVRHHFWEGNAGAIQPGKRPTLSIRKPSFLVIVYYIMQRRAISGKRGKRISAETNGLDEVSAFWQS